MSYNTKKGPFSITSGKRSQTHSGVPESLWNVQKPKDHNFLHRSYPQLFFQIRKIIFFEIEKKIKKYFWDFFRFFSVFSKIKIFWKTWKFQNFQNFWKFWKINIFDILIFENLRFENFRYPNFRKIRIWKLKN